MKLLLLCTGCYGRENVWTKIDFQIFPELGLTRMCWVSQSFYCPQTVHHFYSSPNFCSRCTVSISFNVIYKICLLYFRFTCKLCTERCPVQFQIHWKFWTKGVSAVHSAFQCRQWTSNLTSNLSHAQFQHNMFFVDTVIMYCSNSSVIIFTANETANRAFCPFLCLLLQLHCRYHLLKYSPYSCIIPLFFDIFQNFYLVIHVLFV